MAVDLEINRHYVLSNDEVIRIRGEVLKGTIEYDAGARFYDCERRLYDSEGNSTDFGDSLGALSIVEEATIEQAEKFVSSSLTYNVIRKIKNKTAISREHPKFKMAVGRTYYNRFGSKFDIVGYDGTHFTNHDEHLYDAFGRSSDEGISMHDIIAIDVN
jgi:hypothetical protein